MARGKKTVRELSTEEKLQAALVSVEEQPYVVPENWCWTRLGKITSIIGGGTPSTSKKEYYDGGLIPWLSPADLSGYRDTYISNGSKNITELGLEKSSARMLPANTVCLSSRAPIGYVVITQNPLCTNQGFKSFLPSPCHMPEYLYWYLKGNKELLEKYASGTTFLEISGSKASLIEFPLPPLAEQHRIVTRIESLFAKLDEAKDKAQAVVDGYELRRSAILHKAFSGELTRKWREENGEKIENWSTKPLSIITINHDSKRIPLSKDERSRLERKYDYYGASGVIDQVEMYLFDGRYLLVGEDGANLVTRSKPIAFIAEGKFWVNNHAHILEAKNGADLDYLCNYINSIDLLPYVTGSAQPKMTQSKMNTIPIIVPPLGEQEIIVKILNDIIAKEQKAKDSAESVISQIDTMKKAVLARAFRGELGTNDPAEESAVALLKKIL